MWSYVVAVPTCAALAACGPSSNADEAHGVGDDDASSVGGATAVGGAIGVGGATGAGANGGTGAIINVGGTSAGTAGSDQYAATVTLAGIYKTDGRPDDAVKTYEKAIGIKSNDPVAILALAASIRTLDARKTWSSDLYLWERAVASNPSLM